MTTTLQAIGLVAWCAVMGRWLVLIVATRSVTAAAAGVITEVLDLASIPAKAAIDRVRHRGER